MNRTQLERELAKRADVKVKDVENVIYALEEIIEESVIRREKINIVGLLEIDSKEVKAQPRVNPLTGEEILCDAYIKPTVKFKVTFKKRVKDATKNTVD